MLKKSQKAEGLLVSKLNLVILWGEQKLNWEATKIMKQGKLYRMFQCFARNVINYYNFFFILYLINVIFNTSAATLDLTMSVTLTSQSSCTLNYTILTLLYPFSLHHDLLIATMYDLHDPSFFPIASKLIYVIPKFRLFQVSCSNNEFLDCVVFALHLSTPTDSTVSTILHCLIGPYTFHKTSQPDGNTDTMTVVL